MCEFLKKYIVMFCFGVTLFFTASIASATLMIDVTDVGGGQTRWEFSGSATAVSGSKQNSYWGESWVGGTGDPVNNDNGYVFSIVSGSGSLTSTSGGTEVMVDIAMEDMGLGNQRVSGRVDKVNWNMGDILSWAGIVTINQPFANLNAGVYSTNAILGTTLTGGGFQLNITGAQSVPEPAIIVLFGLGLVGLGFARRRSQA